MTEAGEGGLTFFGLLHGDGILLLFLRGRGGRLVGFGSAAFLPQVFGHVVDVLVVFGRTVVFNVIYADRPSFNLPANTTDSTTADRLNLFYLLQVMISLFIFIEIKR